MKKVYSTHDISGMLNVDISTVTNWIDDGKLKAYRTPGGHRRVKKEAFRRFVKKYKIPYGKEGEKLRVLIVDDDAGIRETVAKIITKRFRKFSVFEADNGFIAGKILAAEDIDLLLLDIRMPGMDGFDIMQQIREDPTLGFPRIIVITGFPETGLEDQVKEYGAAGLIIKPFEVEHIVKIIDEIIS